MKAFACSVLAIGALFLAAAAHAQTPRLTALTVDPVQLTLAHQHDEQRLLISGKFADDTVRDLTRTAQYRSVDPKIATVTATGIVHPVAPGETTIEITTGDQKQVAAVVVKSAAQRPVSFVHDVMPLFAKAGCNSGACHGSASGKKGFKVSLRGYDPGVDYFTLTRGTNGRRLNRDNPEQSLLLLKPTGQVVHEGGQRFSPDSAYAQLLTRWIKEGVISDLAAAPKLVGLDVAVVSHLRTAESAAATARPRSLQRRQRPRCHRRRPLQQQQRNRCHRRRGWACAIAGPG
jgi:hypothetical protein